MHGEPITISGSELLARAIQHETDHLDGILFIDKLDTEARKHAMKTMRESDWFGLEKPTTKVSHHATNGFGLGCASSSTVPLRSPYLPWTRSPPPTTTRWVW